MKKVMKELNKKATEHYLKIKLFANDTSGSDTTEKIAMVVAAVVIAGLLIMVVKNNMGDLFQTIFDTASAKLNGMF